MLNSTALTSTLRMGRAVNAGRICTVCCRPAAQGGSYCSAPHQTPADMREAKALAMRAVITRKGR